MTKTKTGLVIGSRHQPEQPHIGTGTRAMAALAMMLVVAGLVIFGVQLGRGYSLFN